MGAYIAMTGFLFIGGNLKPRVAILESRYSEKSLNHELKISS